MCTLRRKRSRKYHQLLHNKLKNISTWLKANKLSLNVKKTHYIIFHRAGVPNLLALATPYLKFETHVIPYLGRTIISFIFLLFSVKEREIHIKKNTKIKLKSCNYLLPNQITWVQPKFTKWAYIPYNNINIGLNSYLTQLVGCLMLHLSSKL